MADVKVFLGTGDPELNNLLAADKGENGLCVGRAETLDAKDRDGKPIAKLSSCRKVTFIETTVILIEGGAGTGKTTLALQIANAIASAEDKNKKACKEEEMNWSVVFLSLEQTADSLQNAAKSFGFGEIIDVTKRNTPPEHKMDANKVLCHRLSPLPLSEQKQEVIFETRFAELQHMVLKHHGIKEYNTLFVIDSLSAFTGHTLTRSQLYQLFSLFKAHTIPLIVTLEQPDSINSVISSDFETPCFLADIVIKLTREDSSGYLEFFLEISKSRVCRQGLGKHLYKTRTTQNAEEMGTSNQKPRTGLVIYPSVHFIISQSRLSNTTWPEKPFRISEELHEQGGFELEGNIRNPACFALQGPAGTHKLALGLNLGISYVDDTVRDKQRNAFQERFRKKFGVKKSLEFLKAKLLVVTFGGQGAIDFKGVAWLKNQRYLYGLCLKELAQAEIKGTKAELKYYEATNYDSILELTRERLPVRECAKRAEVTVLTFQIGVLTPEECIYRINKELEKETKENPYHSVLISDTAELCTGFPLLSKDPMFFAALLDLFETKGLLTVGLGVLSSDSPNLREINLTLMAKATHRMRFAHYPNVEDLMKGMVGNKRFEKRNEEKLKAMTQEERRVEAAKRPLLTEQLVSVVIDNVTGKNYKRQPKWISVKDVKLTPEQKTKLKIDDPNPKRLLCSSFEDPKIGWLGQDDEGIAFDAAE
jgi:KaiC/GvpD/RAD55 family RecA-like ATPase